MKKRKFLITVLLFLVSVGLNACSTPEDPVVDSETAYLDELEDGKFYIRHRKNICDEVYLGDSTVADSPITDGASADRICWFKEDWENVPTLYEGEHLIMYTENVLTEQFSFERYADVGYTIGLRVPAVSVTGRLQLNTDVQELLTYPEGDTDEINDLPNETVILESLGSQKLRASRISDTYERKSGFCNISGNYDTTNLLSTYGTILNLTQNESYEAEVYNGTVLSKYTFKADVRVLGSMEVIKSNNYEFESGRILIVTIPEWLESGYYMINGQGLFRYEKDAVFDEEKQEYIVSTTDYNIPNLPPEDENDGIEFTDLKNMVITIDPDDYIEEELSSTGEQIPSSREETKEFTFTTLVYNEENDAYEETVATLNSKGNIFEIEVPFAGIIKFTVSFIGYNEKNELITSAGITTPEEKYYAMQERDGHLEACFETSETGKYQFIFYDLGEYIPEISIQEMVVE